MNHKHGDYIVARHNMGGFRDTLRDEDMHAGDRREVLIGGRWIIARYEADFGTSEAWLYLSDAVLPLNRPTMRCRWLQPQ